MTLSWRQIAAYLEFSDRIERSERAEALMNAAYGAQGDDKAIMKRVNEIIGHHPIDEV